MMHGNDMMPGRGAPVLPILYPFMYLRVGTTPVGGA